MDGGFATYDKFRDSSMPESWCTSHPDVTPLALRALLPYQEKYQVARSVSDAIQCLSADCLPDGTLPAFWWILRWYTAAAWMETWDMLGKYNHEIDVFPRLHWEAAEQDCHDCTSILDEALLMECAVYSGKTDIVTKIRERLVSTQLPNGLWPVEPALCQTTPGVYQPWELDQRETICPEEFGIYSTASILRALALVEDQNLREWPP